MKRPMVAVWVAGAGLWLWLFAGVMFGDRNFACRDAAHFYYPLYQLVQNEWGEGRIPLWNPYDNGGQPLLANPVTGVFYPVKLLFTLPIPYRLSYAAYILWHVLQAALATAWIARSWGASRLAAALAGLSFAFCGNVLFQHGNLIFLVGAAWLPLAWWCGERMLRLRCARSALGLGVCLAFMVLGGDPQIAYLAGLSTAAYGLMLWRQSRFENGPTSEMASKTGSKKTSPKKNTKLVSVERNSINTSVVGDDSSNHSLAHAIRHPAGLLAIAALSAGLLCAIQVLPTEEFNRRSTRTLVPVPRNLFELAGSAFSQNSSLRGASQFQPMAAPWYAGLVGKPPLSDLHHQSLYEFSVGPWRLLEYFFPNVSGRQFPTHGRWLEILPAEGMTWVPSLYMGLIPCVLALTALRWRRFSPSEAIAAEPNLILRDPALVHWLSWLVLIFVIMSWGGYAPGWIARCLTTGEFTPPGKHASAHIVNQGLPVGDEFGGLYWFCTVLLPGFVQFRFPGKMLVPAALALSWLAALQFDRISSDPAARRRFQLWMRRLMGVSLAGALGTLALAVVWPSLANHVSPDRYWGKFDLWSSYADLLGAFVQTTLLAACCGWMPWPMNSSDANSVTALAQRPAFALVLLTIIDLGWANGWMVPTAPAGCWENEPRCVALIAAADRQRDEQSSAVGTSSSAAAPIAGMPQPYRVFRVSNWTPPSWTTQVNPQHIDKAMQWDRDTLVSKFHLDQRLELMKGGNTLELSEISPNFNVAFLPQEDGAVQYVQPRRGMDLWNVKYFILPTEDNATSMQETALGLTKAWAEPNWTREQPQGQPLGPPLPDAVPAPAEFLADTPDVRVLFNPSYLPRAWIVHDILAIPPLESDSSPVAMLTRQALLFPAEMHLDPRRTVVVENQELADNRLMPKPNPPTNVPGEFVHITRYEPLAVDMEGETKIPGAVILGDADYPGWELEVTLNDAPFAQAEGFRANLGMRGVLLPPGKFKLSYRYRPFWFYVGSAVSASAWLTMIGGVLFIGLQSRIGRRRSAITLTG